MNIIHQYTNTRFPDAKIVSSYIHVSLEDFMHISVLQFYAQNYDQFDLCVKQFFFFKDYCIKTTIIRNRHTFCFQRSISDCYEQVRDIIIVLEVVRTFNGIYVKYR